MLTVHVAMSVGWLGLDAALVALEVTGLSADNPAVPVGIATATAMIACWVLVPVVFVSLVSGLALALSTPWGLVRYWWVLAKCGIAMVLAAAGMLYLVPRLPKIFAGGGELADTQTLIARSAALMLLLAATGISVVKPWGRTPRGRRIPVKFFPIPRPSRRVRAVVLTVHVAMSVGWLGLDGALVALEVTGMFTVNPAVPVRSAPAVAMIACWVLVPAVFVSLVSGLALALSTPSDLARYYRWVLARCGIAMALAAAGLLYLVPRLPEIFAGGGELAEMQPLIGRSVGLMLLLAATGIAVIKPWGGAPWTPGPLMPQPLMPQPLMPQPPLGSGQQK